MTIGKDKLEHFAVCLIPALVFGGYGVILSTGLAIGKEYGDSKAIGNKWDWLDIVADALGIIVGFALNRIIYSLCF